MSAQRNFLFPLVVLGLVVLHYTVRPALDWRASIDFLMIAVLLVAVRGRPGVAALCGCVIGIISDSLAPAAFGAGALAYTLIAYSASSLKSAFFADNVSLFVVSIFVGKWLADLIYLSAEQRLGASAFLLQAILWSPLAAAATAMVGFGVFAAIRPLMAPPRR